MALGILFKVPQMWKTAKTAFGVVKGARATAVVGATVKVGATTAMGAHVMDVQATSGKSNAVLDSLTSSSALGIKSFSQQSRNFEITSRPEYKIHFMSEFLGIDGTPIRVSAYLPETISSDISSSYRAPFDESIFGGNLTGNIAKALGNTGIVQEMTFKIWENSNGLTFNIPIQFVADDEYEGQQLTDINIPILNLKKLCVPSKVPGSTFLRPPGPSIKFKSGTDRIGREIPNELSTDQGSQDTDSIVRTLTSAFSYLSPGRLVDSVANNLTFDKRTSVYIGEFLTLDNVVIESVSETYDMVLGPDRKPLRASVNVTFSTAFTPTIQDINSYYNYSIANIPNNATE